MKLTKLLTAISIMPLLGACTTVREDPRSLASGHPSLYRNTDSHSVGTRTSGGSGTSGRTGISVSEPQPTPIRVKPGTQPAQYLNTNSPSAAPAGSTASPYDRPGSASPLRHDTPDQPLYRR